jgi:hypothetical protein
MVCTTLNKILERSPCAPSWKKLLRGLRKRKADDELLPFAKIVDICGLEDALWATRSAPEYNQAWRYFACACAYRVAHLSEDPRVLSVIQMVERVADGDAIEAELASARDIAGDAIEDALAACEAGGSSRAASYAAQAAQDTALYPELAAFLAPKSAEIAVALSLARATGRKAEKEWQRQAFLDIVGAGN